MDPLFEKKLITTKEAGEISGYHSDYLARLARSGKILGKRIGHTWLIDQESLARFVEEQDHHKIDYARALARSREEEYALHQNGAQGATRLYVETVVPKVLSGTGERQAVLRKHISAPASIDVKTIGHSRRVSVMSEIHIGKPSLLSRAFTLSLSFALVISSALIARAEFVPQLASDAREIIRDAAFGFGETFGDIPSRIANRIVAAQHAPRASEWMLLASGYSPVVFSFDPTTLRMPLGTGSQSHNLTAMFPRRVPEHVPSSITFQNVQSFARGAYGLVMDPSRIPRSLASAHASLGQSAYAVIKQSFAAYDSLIRISGARALDLGIAGRDALAKTPRLVTNFNLAFGKAVIGAAHYALGAHEAATYAVAAAAPESARVAVSLIGGAGDVLARTTSGIPATLAGLYLEATAVPAYAAPRIASAAFSLEYAFASRFLSAADSTARAYLATIEHTGTLAYDAITFTSTVLPAAEPLIAYAVKLPFVLEDAYLAAIGNAAVALNTLTDTIAPSTAAVIAAVEPTLNFGERTALATYTTITDLFTSAANALAYLIGPPPTIVMPVIPERPIVAVATTTPPTSTPTLQPTTVISSPTYTTIVRGVTENFVNQSLATLRADLLTTVSGMLKPVASQTITNLTTIQQVNRIEDLSNLIVRNGDLRGGALTNATNVTGTNASFTNLTATNLTAGASSLSTTNVTGDLTTTGTVTSYTSAAAPYFTATSTTATSTFAGRFAVGTSTPYGEGLLTVGTSSPSLYVSSNTGYVGIGTTTPLSAFALAGGASIGTNYNVAAPANGLIVEGNVGIGTTSPSSALAVTGDFFLTGSTTITGADKGIVFTGTGNHDITATGGTLRIGSNTIIGNIQALDDTVDIGTPAVRFDKIYANEVNASTVVGTLSGGNLLSETFSINSDNATADTEDSFLAFERGTVSPNALLTWNSAGSAKRFEFNQPLFIQNASASTTLTTFDLKSVAGQTADIFRIASSSGDYLLNFTAGGKLGIGTTTPAQKLTLYDGTFRNGLSSLSSSDQWVDQSITDGGGFPVLNFNRGNSGVVFFDTATSFSLLKSIAVTGSVLVGGAAPTVGVNGTGTLTVQSGGANPIIFKTNSTEVARIDSAGKVGIASTSPWGLLSVNPNGITGPGFVVGSSTKTDFVVTNGGNVGIGTTSPTQKLVVQGNVAVGTSSAYMIERVAGASGQYFRVLDESSDTIRIGAIALGAGTFGNAALFANGAEVLRAQSGGNVGIGTTSPFTKLAVSGGDLYVDGLNSVALTLNKQSAAFESIINFAQLGTAIATIQHTTSGNFVISGPSSATTQILAGNSGTLALAAAASGVMTMSTNNAEAARITSGGLFGIGTTTPWGQLSASSTGTYPTLAIEQKSTGPAAVFLGGNVGIGTTSPYATLSVSTSVANALVLSGPSVRPYMVFEFPQQGNRWGLGSPEDGANAFALRDLDGSTVPFYVEDLGGDTGTNALRITCGTACGTFSKIGIATTSPSARLSVKGGGTGTGRAFVISNSANAEKLTVLDDGSIGIGITTPGAKLHVAGANDATIVDKSIALSRFWASDADTRASAIFHYQTATTEGLAIGASGNGGTLGQPNQESQIKMFVGASGIVGIGTTTPNQKLSIFNSSADSAIEFSSASGSTYKWTIGQDFSDAGKFKISSSTALGTNDRLVIDGNGNIGIGMSPSYKLDVTSGETIVQRLTGTNTFAEQQLVNGAATLFIQAASTGGHFGSRSAHDLLLDTSAITKVYIKDPSGFVGVASSSPWGLLSVNPNGITGPAFVVGSSTATNFIVTNGGNVGIGTTTPGIYGAVQSKLDVSTTGHANLAVTTLGASNVARLTLNSPSSSWLIDNRGGFDAPNNRLSFNYNNGNELMTIQSGGNVGIGTTTPQQALSVYNGLTTGTFSDNVEVVVTSLNRNASIAIDAVNTASSNMVFRAGNSERGRISYINSTNALTFSVNAGGIAGAGERMRIDSSGNVGIGTTSPYAKLSVQAANGETNTTLFNIASSTVSTTTTHFVVNNMGQVGIGTTTLSDSTAVLTIDSFTAVQSIVGGSTARVDIRGKTNGVSPSIGLFHDTNGFRRDGYYMKLGETGTDLNKLVFVRRVNNSETSPLTLDTAGNVGVASTSPWRTLSVVGTVAFNGLTSSATGNAVCITTAKDITDAGGASCTPSSLRFKENVATLSGGYALSLLDQLTVTSFDYRQGAYSSEDLPGSYGLIAEDVATIDPKLVDYGYDGQPLTLHFEKLTGLTVQAVQELNARTKFIENAATSTVLTVDVAGNVGIGTTTPSHTLEVAGEVGAIGFVNTSAREAKKDVSYDTASSSEARLNQLTNLKVATYRYTIEDEQNPLRLGLIAEDTQAIAPEILSGNGKGIDLYKLATFTLSGVQALAEQVKKHETRIASLEERVAMLESGAVSSASGSPLALSTTSLASAFNSFGALIQKGIAQFNTLVFRQLVASKDADGTSSAASVTILAGNTVVQINNSLVQSGTKVFVTFNSPLTGSWYVSEKKAGSFRVILSEAQAADVSFDYFLVQTEGQIATSTPSGIMGTEGVLSVTQSAGADVVAPVITILGDNPLRLSIGGTFAEPGVTTDDGSPIITFVNGVQREDPASAIDTSAQKTYIVSYQAMDAAGNLSTALRSVMIGSAVPESPSTAETATTTEAVPADTTAPVVSLVGEAAVQITVGDTFTDAGATAVDETDGDLTAAIAVTGSVDTATAGIYTLTYTATDAAGNVGTASRVVTVAIPAEAPAEAP